MWGAGTALFLLVYFIGDGDVLVMTENIFFERFNPY